MVFIVCFYIEKHLMLSFFQWKGGAKIYIIKSEGGKPLWFRIGLAFINVLGRHSEKC